MIATGDRNSVAVGGRRQESELRACGQQRRQSRAKTSPPVLDPQIFQRFRINAQAFQRLFRGGPRVYDGLGEVCSTVARYSAQTHMRKRSHFAALPAGPRTRSRSRSREKDKPQSISCMPLKTHEKTQQSNSPRARLPGVQAAWRACFASVRAAYKNERTKPFFDARPRGNR